MRPPVLPALALGLALCGPLAVGGGCQYEEPAPFVEGLQLGKECVDADTLNQGREGFMLYCYACHGEKGDGKGPASHYLRPPPRDFRSTTFKFAGTPEGLPHDQDLERIVRQGLTGTAMLPWDVPPTTLEHILQYIKTFSPQVISTPPSLPSWKEEKAREPALTPEAFYRLQADAFMNWLTCYQAYPDDPLSSTCQTRAWTLRGEGWRAPDAELGERIVPGNDPWGDGQRAQAVARGKALYHGFAQCGSCHANYASEADVKEMAHAFGKEPALRPNLYYSEPKQSSYTVAVPRAPSCGADADCTDDPTKRDRYKCVAGKCDLYVKILPPDFTVDPVRGGSDLKSLYRTIRAGIPGTAMPPWSADKMPSYKPALETAMRVAKDQGAAILEKAAASERKEATDEARKEIEALEKAALAAATAAGDKDLWALAHYLQHLVGWKDTPEAWELKRRLVDAASR